MDSAWCPVCDKQIEPKRTTLLVPRKQQPTQQQPSHAPPPAPPSSPRRKGPPRRGGLVSGTGRLRPNGTVKPPAMKTRIIIDQGPTPLYCSDECRLADLSRTRRGAPLDPHAEEPPQPASPQQVFPASSSETSSSAGGSAPMTSMERFNAFYGFPALPDPPPVCEPEPSRDLRTHQYTGGIIMAGRLINSLVPPPAKPQVGRYRNPQEPRKPTPGWNDGSNHWRAAVYNSTPPPDSPFSPPQNYVPARTRRLARAASAAPNVPEPSMPPTSRSASASEALLSSFSENFARRSESRASLYAGGGSSSPAPSAASTHSLPSPTKLRSLVPSGAEGKLLVPDVKLKVHSSSSASLSSRWSSPPTSSSRPSASTSVRSPLSVTSDSDEDTECSPASTSPTTRLSRKPKSPPENTRSWSYENVKTYDMMPMPPRRVKRREKRIVDGEEVEVEVEVEDFERKRLFLFPPSVRVSVP